MKIQTKAALVTLLAICLSHYPVASFGQNPSNDLDGTKSSLDSSAPSIVPKKRQNNFWMDQKVRLSKDILTGLAMGDFDTIGRSAEIMKGLNRLERFVRRTPEGYREQMSQFNYANKKLLSAVDAENLEAATLAFHQLTTSCVSCHQALRKSNPAQNNAN